MSVAALVLAVGVVVGVAWLVSRAVAWSDVHRDRHVDRPDRGTRYEQEADERAQRKEIDRIAAQRGVLPEALVPPARARLEQLQAQWSRRTPALVAYAACGPVAYLALLAGADHPRDSWLSLLWIIFGPAVAARQLHQEVVRLERAVRGYRAPTT